MASESFEVIAETRDDMGKGASRRLRRTGMVPAVIYGGSKDPQSISIEHNEVIKHLEHEAFYSHILTVKVGGAAEKAVLKDVQRHPYRAQILHMDFLRVGNDDVIKMHVPLHFINEEACPGVKTGGGLLTHNLTDVEISCMAKDLPEFIEVDLGELQVGDAVHLSNLKLPEGVQVVQLSHGPEHDLPVVSCHKGRGAAAEDEEASEE